jgi:hypothetical protein
LCTDTARGIENMCTGKSPGLDGIVLEFYKEFWQLVGEDYFTLVPK